jgi:hypothetical protein
MENDEQPSNLIVLIEEIPTGPQGDSAPDHVDGSKLSHPRNGPCCQQASIYLIILYSGWWLTYPSEKY